MRTNDVTSAERATGELSYVHGVSDVPFIGATIGDFFDQVATRYAGEEALVVRHQQVRWTWQELQARVNNLAAGLLRLGLKPGDRIGIWSQNNAEWVLTQFATAKAGLILVNINPAYRRTELQHALTLVQCRALIVSPSFKSSDYLAIVNELVPRLAQPTGSHSGDVDLASLEFVIRLGAAATPSMLNFDDLLQPATSEELDRLAAIGRTLQFDDAINIQFTSGTTGAPKGATLTHHNILNNGYFVGEA